jgi:hypothetical protein
VFGDLTRRPAKPSTAKLVVEGGIEPTLFDEKVDLLVGTRGSDDPASPQFRQLTRYVAYGTGGT